MTEKEFDELWQRAEGEGYGRRLAEEYPVWRQKQHRITGFAMASVVVAAIAFPMLNMHHYQSKDYESVYCNKGGTSNEQWASLASDMLMEI